MVSDRVRPVRRRRSPATLASPAPSATNPAAAPRPAESQSRPPFTGSAAAWYWVMGWGLIGQVGGPGSRDAVLWYSVTGRGFVGQVGGPGSRDAVVFWVACRGGAREGRRGEDGGQRCGDAGGEHDAPCGG